MGRVGQGGEKSCQTMQGEGKALASEITITAGPRVFAPPDPPLPLVLLHSLQAACVDIAKDL